MFIVVFKKKPVFGFWELAPKRIRILYANLLLKIIENETFKQCKTLIFFVLD